MPPEPGHATTEAAFHTALWEADPPEGLTAPAPDEVPRRFAVYRNNIRHSLSRALAARFPVTEALVGTEFFTAMAGVFIAEAPPTSPVLQDWGAAFPGFLDRFPPVAHLPWLGDVARLEWARGRAVHAADAPLAPPDLLAAPDAEALRLRLHPSVVIYRSDHPALSIWQAHQTGAVRGPLPPGPEHALIGRQPDFTVVVAPVDAGTHAVLTALASGAPLGRAAAQADPTTALTLLLRHGLITAPPDRRHAMSPVTDTAPPQGTATRARQLVLRLNRLGGLIPQDLVALAARVFPAVVFWQSARTKVEGFSIREQTFFLFEHVYALPLIPPAWAAVAATLAEHILPVLLILGLMSRISALGLLIMTAVIQIFVFPAAWVTHGLWAVALLVVLTHGPGRLSLDHLLGLDQRARQQ